MVAARTLAAWAFLAWMSLLQPGSYGLPKVIKIGGLFDTEDEEQELAFRIAVEWLNRDKDILPRSRLVAQVERIRSGDCYEADKKVCSLLAKGVAAVFGPQDAAANAHVGSVLDELEVAHVAARWVAPRRPAPSVNLHPSAAVLATWYVSLVKHLGWRNFTLLYDEDQGLLRLQNFLKEAEENKWQVQLYRFEEDKPYRNVFWELKRDLKKLKEDNQKIVLDVGRRALIPVLKQAQQVGMVTENQQYLITCLDLHTLDLSDFKYGMANITGLRLIQESNPEYQMLYQEIMARMPYSHRKQKALGLRTETALIYDAVRLFAQALQELDASKEVGRFHPISCDASAPAQGTDGTSLLNYMKSSNMNGITGLITFDGEGYRSVFQLDLTFLTEDGLIKLGDLLPGQNINITRNLTTEAQPEHKKFIITTIVSQPYVMLKNSSKGLQGNDRFEGFCIDLVEALSQILHFSYEIKLVKDKQYGSKSGDTWTGMIGEVMRGEANMAVAGLSINSKREQAVDFTMPFMNTGISILYKKPTTKVTSLFSFLSPFSNEVWIYLMGAYFGVSLVAFLVGRLTPYEWINPHPCRQDDIVVENIFTVRNSMWLMTGSLMQQGSDLIPTAFSTRTAASYWNFFTLIMISSYTANLAAFLTVEKVVFPFKNADDLSEQEKIQYGCLGSGTTRSFFEDSNITTYQKMWTFMASHPSVLVEHNDLGKEKVYGGDYAYLMESATIEYLTERECSLTQIGGLLDSKGYGIATKKGNREMTSWLSSGILRLQEEGALHTLKERWWRQKGGGKCLPSASSSKVQELGLGNVGGVFVVLIFGLGVATLIALIEFKWTSSQWFNPDQETFWEMIKKELKFALSFDIKTKPVPKLKKNVEPQTSTPNNSRSSIPSHGTT